jgi:tetratricopeptide (TPR) repeat protein
MNHQPRYLVLTRPTLDMNLLEQVTGLKYKLMKVSLARYPIYRLVRVQPVEDNPITWTWQRKMEIMDRLTRGNHATGINALDVGKGRIKKAMAECRKMLRLNPFDREGQIFLADLLAETGQPQRGLSILQTLLNKNPGSPGIRAQLARLHLKAGNLEQAEVFLQLEINKFGFHSATHLVSGLYHLEIRNYDQSIHHLETARKELPFNNDLLLPLARACMESGNLDQSRHYLETIRKEATTPLDDGLRTQACVLLAQLNSGKCPEFESLRKYALEDSQNPSLQYALGSALEKNERPLQALEIFTKLTQELAPGHLCAAAWFRRARLSESPNQRTMLESCLKMNPDHQEAKHMLNHLEVLHEPT